jgi:hypothetical protein
MTKTSSETTPANAASLLERAVYRVCRGVATLCLRQGLSAREATEILKKAFVDIAREQYGISGRPMNKSRIATLAGLTRAEVSKLVDRPKPGNEARVSVHPLNKLIARWSMEQPWSDADGQPRVLALDGSKSSFQSLVGSASGDLAWQTLLRELKRLELVEVQEDQFVRLTQSGFMPSGEASERIPFFGEDVASLAHTINHNLHCSQEQRTFQRRVVFPSLNPDGMALLKEIAADEGQRLLENLNHILKPYAKPASANGSEMTGLGIYVFNQHLLDGEQQ